MTRNRALQSILEEYVSHYDRLRDAAEPLQISRSRLGAILKGDHQFDEVTALRLAKASGVSADTILRHLGKSEVADLLRGLYGEPVTGLDAVERDVLRRRAALPADARKAVDLLLARLSEG